MSTICEKCKFRYECSDIEKVIKPNPDGTCYAYEQDKMISSNLKDGPFVPSTILNASMAAAYAAFGRSKPKFPKIKNVIFNNPATIVFWEDGTKTIVKCQDGDIFDPEKGLTMAISKKALGNKGNYCNEIKKWTEPYLEETQKLVRVFKNFEEQMNKLRENLNADPGRSIIAQRRLRDNM